LLYHKNSIFRLLNLFSMSQSKLDLALPQLDSLGVRPFTEVEMTAMYDALSQAIAIGITRTGEPTTADGGLLALPTGIEPISLDQVQQVPDGTPVITAACGGTNWMFAVATKQADGKMTLSEPVVRPIPEDERQHTFQSLIDLMADEILTVGREYHLLETSQLPIAISFGFPQHNVRTDDGDIDARLTSKQLPKFWQITDLDETLPVDQQVSLSGLLRESLLARGFVSIGSIVFVNDTVAVALDVQHGDGADLPVGFVFGTGTNGAMFANTEKGIVNLEIGHAGVVPRDAVLDMMEQHQWVPNTHGIMEYWMGGGYLPGRCAATILGLRDQFIDADQLASSIVNSTNQAIVSDLADTTSSPQQLQLHVAPQEFAMIQTIAQRVLHQAGQLIGLHIAAVCQAVNYTTGSTHVPYEGSLLAKGYRVATITDATVKHLLPGSDITPYRASGILGIAKLALLKTQARNQ
jgi:hexokinase